MGRKKKSLDRREKGLDSELVPTDPAINVSSWVSMSPPWVSMSPPGLRLAPHVAPLKVGSLAEEKRTLLHSSIFTQHSFSHQPFSFAAKMGILLCNFCQ